jgi:redox-sensitive bicupin YhaK (pirin superfamily)
LPIVSQEQKPEMAFIHQDLTLYLSEIEEGKSLKFKQKEGRRIYLFVMEGEIQVNGEQVLKKRDAARITDLHQIQVYAKKEASVMLIDLP